MEKLHARDYREIAREKLSGFWLVSVLAVIIVSILAGETMFSVSMNMPTDIDVDSLFEDVYVYDTDALEDEETYVKVTEFLYNNTTFIIVSNLLVYTFLFWSLITIIFGGATRVGYSQFKINLLKGEARIKDIFSHYDIFGKAFLTKMLIDIFIILWSLLFIIPGIINALAYSMTYYILAENPDMGVMEAIKASKEMMKGHKWQLFCLEISFIGWEILAAFTLGFGYLFLIPYVETSVAVFYDNIKGINNANFVDVE